jgi:cellulose synthase/poly-beta-1,6-N-acetylglucosamine synthase-like glycosyltransferase
MPPLRELQDAPPPSAVGGPPSVVGTPPSSVANASVVAGQPSAVAVPSYPSLSIIIPARNEAKNLQRLLPSLRALDYPGEVEIIVVDDQSSDTTAEVAARLGARVEKVESVPVGWHGKPHACHVGALSARGDWLLFTDADTVHAHDSARRAVSFAQDHALDGLTLFLKQASNTILDGAVLMTAFAGLFAGVRETNRLMNGQYILLRRNVYVASGGFESVRNQPLEDLAMGNRLRSMRYTVVALNGETAATVRMYDSPEQMWHGMTRLGAGSLEWSGSGSLLTVLFTTALVSPLLVLLGVLTGSLRLAWLPITWLAASASVLPFARRFGSLWLTALAPIGALFVLLAAVWGLAARILGLGVHWRGRHV